MARLGGKRLLLAMLAIFLLAVVPAIFVPTLMCRQAPPELKDLGDVKFSLIDESGRPFTEEALRGHPTIVDFIFTRCDSICPAVTARMLQIEEKTRDKRGEAIRFLSITVDPKYDTPEKLAAYAAKYGISPNRWRLLTGPPAVIDEVVVKTFFNSTDPNGTSPAGAPQIAHNGHFILVDGELKIRGTYDSNDVQRMEDLMRAARYLARTQRHGYKFGGT